MDQTDQCTYLKNLHPRTFLSYDCPHYRTIHIHTVINSYHMTCIQNSPDMYGYVGGHHCPPIPGTDHSYGERCSEQKESTRLYFHTRNIRLCLFLHRGCNFFSYNESETILYDQILYRSYDSFIKP